MFRDAVFLCLLGMITLPALARHVHVEAGASAPIVGSKLIFVNGPAFEAESGFLVHLLPIHSPLYGDIYYGGSDITFTSAARTPDNGGPELFAALPGTHVVMVFDSVMGPPGGAISFWDSFDGFFDATEITFTVPVGTKGGINQFSLSENDGSEGVDPYGHIHGRKVSANLPGLYTVGFRLIDSAHNGPNGGPQHESSDLAWFNFQSGTTIANIVHLQGKVVLTFGTESGKTYFIETAENLGDGNNWHTVLGPIDGTDRLLTEELSAPSVASAFFRLRVE